MVFTVFSFPTEQWCIDELESAFKVAVRQNENLIIKYNTFIYVIHPDIEREHRIQKWKEIYQEAQSP